MSKVIELDVSATLGRRVAFAPLGGRLLRGRFCFSEAARQEPQAILLASEWGDAIPGQRLVVDLQAGTAAIVEPLWEPKFRAIREKIERRGQRLPDPREEFHAIDKGTWAFWLRRLVDNGSLTIAAGDLGTLESLRSAYGPPKLASTPKDPASDRLDKMFAVLWAVLSERQRKDAEAMLTAAAAE